MNRPLIIDSFAGGGGASTGIEIAPTEDYEVELSQLHGALVPFLEDRA